MNPRLRRPLSVIGLVTIVAIAIFVVPRGLSLYFQIRGGQRIEYVLRFEEGLDALDCEPFPPNDEDSRSEVKQGIADLIRAIGLNKNNAQAYYYLGRAYCLLGDAENAVENYSRYTEIRPENPLGYISLGFAYERIGELLLSKISWNTANIDPETFQKYGDIEFNAGSYQNAYQWYERSDYLNAEFSPERQFKWGVAAILSENEFPKMIDVGDLPIYSLSESITIDGDQLHWFRGEDSYWNIFYGQPLSEHPTGEQGIGGMWWNGAAVVIVNSPCSTTFNIKLSALHDGLVDEIGQLQILKNLTPVAVFTLSETWQEYEREIELTKGYHIIGVRYVKDVGDVFIGKLFVDQSSECES